MTTSPDPAAATPPPEPPPPGLPQAIERRRATRSFDPAQPLPGHLLERILRLATLAPSSFNLQPWRFVVVRSAARRETLRQCAYGQSKLAEAPVVIIVLGARHPHRAYLDAILAEQVHRHVVDSGQLATLRGRISSTLDRRPDPDVWTTRSTMLAAATLMLAAESLGVASAPMEGFDESRVRAAFGIPDDHAVCLLIALGYPASEKPFPGRLELDQVCYAEHFGQPWPGTP